MKINEVTSKQLDEGPIDTIKQIGAGVKGAYQGLKAGGLGGVAAGAQAGYQAKGAALAQTEKVKAVAKQALQKWAAYNQNVKTSSGADATPEQAVQWLAQFMGQPPRTPQPAGSNPAQIQQWLTKEIAGYMAQKELGGTKPTAGTTPPAQPTTTTQPNAQPTPNQTQTPPADEPMRMGGQKLDPNNPKEKAIIDKVNAQNQQTQTQQPVTPTKTWRYKAPMGDLEINVGTTQDGRVFIQDDNTGEWHEENDKDNIEMILDPANRADANGQGRLPDISNLTKEELLQLKQIGRAHV